ncbi:hypothetical protein M1D51_12385 [Arthrobacter sp. R3-55]
MSADGEAAAKAGFHWREQRLAAAFPVFVSLGFFGILGRDEGQLAARSCLRDDAEIGFSHDTYDGITASHWTVSHEHDGLTGRWYLYGTQRSTFARKRSELGKDSLTSQAGAHPVRF